MAIKRTEGICVCVNYADFLAETLPHNMKHFDHLTIVTSYDDHATQEVCDRLSVECRRTDVMYYDGVFAKSRAIDWGLGYLRRDDWIVQFDADIWLPPTTSQWFQHARLQPDCIYGIDRVNCSGWENWRKFIDRPYDQLAQHQRNCLVLPPPFPLGARISLKEYGGYIPLGFFQMWNAAKCDYRYPLNHDRANCTDVLHSLQWPAEKRLLAPEIIGIHLETGDGAMGANWDGRTTPPFGPTDHLGKPVPKPAPITHPPYVC